MGADLERCIVCNGSHITREGKRYKKLETVQLWRCHSCDRVSLMAYYRGETREQTAAWIKERFGIAVPPRTLSTWLAEYRDLTTYARLRMQCAGLFRPNRLIRSVRLHHQQVYNYRIHQGKLATTLEAEEHRSFKPLAAFLAEMADACPQPLFLTPARASQGKMAFDLDAVQIKAKYNHACRMAALMLQTVTSNRRRHDELQRSCSRRTRPRWRSRCRSFSRRPISPT
ncbi:MAG TPA: hypothetical protein VHW71_02480 [Steroidobacteraceae bacterium]|nr:hypothetical protein [Steroidobacteraceae bacterium]